MIELFASVLVTVTLVASVGMAGYSVWEQRESSRRMLGARVR
jgi:predicted negative regulator of RcsB-dependent stress response